MSKTYYDIYFNFKGEEEYIHVPENRRDIDDLDKVKEILEAEFDRTEYGWLDEATRETLHIGEAIDALIDHLHNNEYSGDEETFLNIAIQKKGMKGDIIS